MSLKYALLEAHLTPAPDDYVAQVQEMISHGMDSIIEMMVQRGSTVTKTDILAVFNDFREVVAEIISRGENINTDLFKTSLSVQGIFDSIMDTFDPKRHSLNVNVQAGTVLKDAIKNIAMEKVTAPEIHPHVLEVKDTITKSVNNIITSRGVVEIVGSMLKIAGDDASNGVYFVDSDNRAHKADTLVDNKPARLIVIAPDLPKGDYTLQIRTQHTGSGTLLKAPRTGTFDKPLSVA